MADTPAPSVETRNGPLAARADELPPYYRTGFTSFQKEAARRDPEHRHRWVRVSARNQQVKRYKGWEPLEDKAEIIRLGIDPALINARNRAQWVDTELWRMPMSRARAIRRHLTERLAERSTSVRNMLNAMADDVVGRSRGRVVPFFGGPGMNDVIERTPAPAPAPAGGKAK